MSRKRKSIKVNKSVLEAKNALNKKYEEKKERRVLSAKSEGQRDYIRAIVENDFTICSGMAGCGKTFVAVGMALQLLDRGQVERIVVARPAIEVGETLGFLPGPLEEKLNPFMRPINDAFQYFRSYSEIQELKNSRILEICSIGHLRGRTLDNSFIILDEAQNATFKQMKMFVTRFGMNSKVVIAGDPTQTDLDYKEAGAFDFICKLFANDSEIALINLGKSDMVRHPLIVKINDKWDSHIDNFKACGKLLGE